MANPIVKPSVQAATAEGAGDEVDALAHYHAGLFVALDGSITSLTVALEVSPDGERWATAQQPDGSAVEITEADLTTDDTSGQDTAALAIAGLYGYQVRANVTAYDGSGSVDAYVMLGGNSGQGTRPTKRHGPAEGP
jgi:hypothetical protein